MANQESPRLSTDLTQGHVAKQLLTFAIPFLASNMLQALYSVADVLIVGKFVGPHGISGVNLGGQVMMVITSLVTGLTIGGTVLVAQYTGARDTAATKKTIGTMFTLFTVLGLIMTVVSLILCDPILRLIETPPEAYDSARNYLYICIIGILFIVGYNTVSSILRGLGDSKRPLYFVLIAAILNIFLDLIFVGPLGWGAGGAAAATTISQGISFILSIWYLRRSNFIFDFKRKSFKIHKSVAMKIVKIGIPSSVQMTLISVSFLFLSSIVNTYGVAASAANGIGIKVDSFAVLPALALSAAIASMAGQNIGAGEYGRAKQTLRYGILFSLLMSIVIFAIVQVFSEQFVVLFSDTSQNLADAEAIRIAEETVRIGKEYLRIVSFSYLVLAFMFSFNGFANGTGNTLFTMVNTFLMIVLLRVPLAHWLSGIMGLNGVFLTLVISPLGGALVGWIFYLSGRWKKGRLTGTVNPDA